MNKVIFVCGFNTHPDEDNGINPYTAFELYFKFSNTDVTFFRYKTTEDLAAVYCRLSKILDTKEHDTIITHSMGSCLCLKYIAETNDMRKIIMCMPYISASKFVRFITYLPFIQNVSIPKCCMVPNSALYYGGNMFNDDAKLVSFNQVYFAITKIFLTDDELVRVINNHKNIRIIYAENEQVSPIDSSILSQIIGKVTISKGKHVSFVNVVHMSDFFNVFTEQIKKLN